MATMKAVRVHEYGGPEVLEYQDAPRPEPAPGEVLVAVHAAGVNPVDWKLRAGYLKDYFSYALPVIPGVDFSGTVAALGAGATGVAVGEEVYGQQDFARPDGTYAEYVAVEASRVAPKPQALDHVHAASVPTAGLAAWHAFFGGGGIGLKKGQTVLIIGGAGGVGTFAVQLAKWVGATVVATASARNEAFLRDIGVDRFVDYGKAGYEASVGKVGAVLDTLGGEAIDREWGFLKPGGVLATVAGQPSEDAAKAHNARGFTVMASAALPDLPKLTDLLDKGIVKPIVTETFPLSEARKAQGLIQTGHARGKIVLKVRN